MIDAELIVIGGSWGGLTAVGKLLSTMPTGCEVPIAIALHRAADSPEGALRSLLQATTRLPVLEAEDKQPIERGRVYLAPADYHLLVEPGYFALSTDARVQYARPSIDVLFESAVGAYGGDVIGVILTGANEDGARGLARIKEAGGVALVQNPGDAEKRAMPDAAIARTVADAILPIDDMGHFLHGLCMVPTPVPAEATTP